MADFSRPHCKFGEKSSISDVDEFTVGYIRKQSEFAFEEIGDQLDDSFETIASIAGLDYAAHEEFYNEEAKKIRFCLAERYLGLCSLSECSTKKLIGEVIADTTQVQIN